MDRYLDMDRYIEREIDRIARVIGDRDTYIDLESEIERWKKREIETVISGRKDR